MDITAKRVNHENEGSYFGSKALRVEITPLTFVIDSYVLVSLL
jgi:hypothetical protein